MGDAYWMYSDGRPQAAAMQSSQGPVKRARSEYAEIPGGTEYGAYIPREEERVGQRVIRDTESIEASYDQYLRSGQISSYGAGDSGGPSSGGVSTHHVADPRLMNVGLVENRSVGYSGGRQEMSLPPDASNTLFVEGLPADCSRREVSHIFRPFVGFQEVRIVNKESKHPGGEPHVLCFADFLTPSQAAIALGALQGYKFDEHDRDSATLRLQFARYAGPRSAWPRGRH
ncbi:unnamed protein product [Spirodela intermedia]|uniref:RRM domain-containing protein n=1 Tax=Spirodela intermedia TaxID=51605 RepID=A0A7I8IZC6_SPIIN|nr:unnamed protein product [Spirodela intermedia]CAA6663345.1 unnamed protein product [Spirodela intermedia]